MKRVITCCRCGRDTKSTVDTDLSVVLRPCGGCGKRQLHVIQPSFMKVLGYCAAISLSLAIFFHLMWEMGA